MTTEEKLALAITALKVISGDPVNDEAYLKVTGQDKIDASMRISRKALAVLNVDMSAPCSMIQLDKLI